MMIVVLYTLYVQNQPPLRCKYSHNFVIYYLIKDMFFTFIGQHNVKTIVREIPKVKNEGGIKAIVKLLLALVVCYLLSTQILAFQCHF